ncbi:MAG: sigma-54-dependent Fis family transcriptional regulator [Candidatus Goldbacteria bacterium]|nr:sigma-54-dependent Fis family transcriptional regulator [Candidatus Goldiibacteriota bacterium]
MYEILIVEDNDELRNIIKETFNEKDYSVFSCENGEDAINLINERDFDVVITDLKLPEADGITVLTEVKKKNSNTEVIMITAYGTIDMAVAAMKKGASEFITKPVSIEHLKMLVSKIIMNKKLKDENSYLKNSIRGKIIGESAQIKDIFRLVDKIAETDATVLITGESGTGKELIAEEIHYKSARRDYPLIKVNCAALSPGVLESELFGHEKGAFTDALYLRKGRFELADNGTIFLDEIAELPLNLQVKLLRVLQDKSFERVGGEKNIKVDVRLIVATNRDIEREVSEGRFRQDLYYRFNVVQINMPPLRERKEDIPALVDYFMNKYSDLAKFRIKGFSKEAIEKLSCYDFPGNVRELENIIQRILVTARNEIIKETDIPYEITGFSGDDLKKTGIVKKVNEYEKNVIINALNQAGGNKGRAADILKITKPTLAAKMKKYRIREKS